MPRELYELGRNSLLRDLGFGQLFGSQQIPNVNELSFLNVGTIDDVLKRDIAAFDWWVMNGDRTLTEAGGNPNLLWSELDSLLFVIDHNLAFDENVTLHSQLDSHVFADSLAEICDDPTLQEHYNIKFERALLELPAIIDDIPERWRYLDDGLTVESHFSVGTVKVVLERYRLNSFWTRS